MSEKYSYLEELFDSFERVEVIDEVIILGRDGGIRRCSFTSEEDREITNDS